MENTFFVFKDAIAIKWGGVAPPEVPALLRADPRYVLPYLTHIAPVAKYNEKLDAFLMTLSANNLVRLKKQFGQIRCTAGQERVEDLRKQWSWFAGVKKRAAEIKGSPSTALQSIDYKVKPLAPYQHLGTLLLTQVERLPMFADCGCLSGDTVIRYNRAGVMRAMTIAQMYENQECSRGNRRHSVKTKVRSLKEDGIRLHPIQHVVQQGVKPVKLLTLEDGRTLKATADHEIHTSRGWVQMADLVALDDVTVDNLVRHKSKSTSNLEVIGSREHRVLHTKGYENFLHGLPETAKVTSVVDAGEEMTYDIVCEDPYRNFVANGIVVHNCGKTFMALVSAEHHIKSGVVPRGKTLICGKIATLYSGWLEDAKKFTDLKIVCLWVPSNYKRKEKIARLLEEDADVYLINHEGVAIYEEALAAKKFEKVIVDESTVLKSFRGLREGMKGGSFGRALSRVSEHANWRVIMSGTPAPNGPQDLWGQFKFLDPTGIFLERQFSDFRSIYMKEVVFGKEDDPNAPRTWEMIASSIPKITDIIAPLSYRVKIRDHLDDLPAKTMLTRKVAMSAEQDKHYKELAEEFLTILDEGDTIAVSVALALFSKFRQITGGFLYDLEKVAHNLGAHNPKLEALDCLLYEEIDQQDKVVIFAQFEHEFTLLLERYKDLNPVSVYGGNSSAKNMANIDAFIKDPSVRLIFLHPKSAAHGITLTMAHYMVFYSISFSAEEDYQAVARIERASQKNAMFVYYLLCRESIDNYMYQTLQRKHRLQAQLIDPSAKEEDVTQLAREFAAQLKEKYPNLIKTINTKPTRRDDGQTREIEAV